MPYLSKEPLYFIRTSVSHYYEAGTGKYAVPKLYQIGAAKRVARTKNNKHRTVDVDGPWEVVPVTFVEGLPLIND